MTVKVTTGPGTVIWYVYGLVHTVKLDGSAQVYGTTWQYILGNTVTKITVGSHTTAFIDFSSGAIAGQHLTLTGYVLGPNGVFNRPVLTITSPASANVTEVGLFDTSTLLFDHLFTVPVVVTAGTPLSIPWNFTDNTGRTGTVSYTVEAVIQSGASFVIVSSNVVTLNYGSFQVGNLNINQTNTNVVPIWFHRSDLAGNNTRVDVLYPNSANLTCNLAYQFASINKTYSSIPSIPLDASNKNSSFLFVNGTNDIVTINCRDLNSANTGKYILTQNFFPFLQQIHDFRAGKYGTTGQFGMLDIVTLCVVIFSMIGFNRINETVGAFFSVAIIGVAAFWGILSFPGVMAAAVAVVLVVTITSTRKSGGF